MVLDSAQMQVQFLNVHVDERWVAVGCTRNPSPSKDPKGLMVGCRPDRSPASVPASFHRVGTQAAVLSQGGGGACRQTSAQHSRVGRVIGTHPSSFALFTAPPGIAGCSPLPLHPALRKHLIQ